MKHIVLVKFEAGFFSNEIKETLKNDYEALSRAMPNDILAVSVHQNCVAREANMDMMIEMTLVGKASLTSYLDHPIHIRIGEKMNSHVVSRVSIDFEN